jgi:hypothetical protein
MSCLGPGRSGVGVQVAMRRRADHASPARNFYAGAGDPAWQPLWRLGIEDGKVRRAGGLHDLEQRTSIANAAPIASQVAVGGSGTGSRQWQQQQQAQCQADWRRGADQGTTLPADCRPPG